MCIITRNISGGSDVQKYVLYLGNVVHLDPDASPDAINQ